MSISGLLSNSYIIVLQRFWQFPGIGLIIRYYVVEYAIQRPLVSFSLEGTLVTYLMKLSLMYLNIFNPILTDKSDENNQGQLQIWTEHSKLIFENRKPVEKSKNHFSINSKVVLIFKIRRLRLKN